DDERFATNAQRLANRPALITELQSALGSMSGEAARQLLESHGVVVGVVRNYDQVMQSPDIAASGIFVSVDDGDQRQLPQPGMPFQLHCMGERPGGCVPRRGQHTVDMLVDLGYEASLIAQWQAANVIYAEALPSSG